MAVVFGHIDLLVKNEKDEIHVSMNLHLCQLLGRKFHCWVDLIHNRVDPGINRTADQATDDGDSNNANDTTSNMRSLALKLGTFQGGFDLV
jgi:hypothetical protein